MPTDEFRISFWESPEINNLSSANKQSRVRFVRQVLTILMSQIALALFMIYLCLTREFFRAIQAEWVSLDIIAIVLMVVSAWAIKKSSLGRKVT